jgi:hypothetical protein
MAGLQIFHSDGNNKPKKTYPKTAIVLEVQPAPPTAVACPVSGGDLSLKSGLRLCFILLFIEI